MPFYVQVFPKERFAQTFSSISRTNNQFTGIRILCLERKSGDEKDRNLYHSRCVIICETIGFAFSQSFSRMLKWGKWGPVPNRLRSLLKTRSKYYIRWRTEFSGRNNDSNNNSKKTQNNSTVSMASRIAASASVRAVGRVRKIRALRAPVTLVSIFLLLFIINQPPQDEKEGPKLLWPNYVIL